MYLYKYQKSRCWQHGPYFHVGRRGTQQKRVHGLHLDKRSWGYVYFLQFRFAIHRLYTLWAYAYNHSHQTCVLFQNQSQGNTSTEYVISNFGVCWTLRCFHCRCSAAQIYSMIMRWKKFKTLAKFFIIPIIHNSKFMSLKRMHTLSLWDMCESHLHSEYHFRLCSPWIPCAHWWRLSTARP